MFPKQSDILDYTITSFNQKELRLLFKEIFSNEIYNVRLDNDTPLIIDAGAYVGLSTIYFKDKFPHSGIISFEPNPNIFPLLQENIISNHLDNIVLHNVALGRKEGIRDFYIDSTNDHNFSTSSFIKNAWNGEQATIPIQVNVKKLSEYINEEIDLLKMDIEGAEGEVLEELRDSGKLKFLKNIIFEYHPTKKNRLEHLARLLEENKFHISTREGIEGRDDPLILVIGKKSSN